MVQYVGTSVNHVMRYNIDQRKAQYVNSDLLLESVTKYVLEVERELRKKGSRDTATFHYNLYSCQIPI
jgi:hypothetical protein